MPNCGAHLNLGDRSERVGLAEVLKKMQFSIATAGGHPSCFEGWDYRDSSKQRFQAVGILESFPFRKRRARIPSRGPCRCRESKFLRYAVADAPGSGRNDRGGVVAEFDRFSH